MKKINSVVPTGTQSEEMTSLNNHLFSEFSIEELEARLETDPLMLSQIFGITVSDDSTAKAADMCPNLTSCEFTCTYTAPCSPVACGKN